MSETGFKKRFSLNSSPVGHGSNWVSDFRSHGFGYKAGNNYSKAMTNYKTTVTAKANIRNISNSVTAKTNEAFALFKKIFQSYSPDEVFVAFNGGKDCTVVLHLLTSYFSENEDLKDYIIRVLYIKPKNTFQELEEFVEHCKKVYKIHVLKYEGSIKPCLEQVCEDVPNLKAVLMGVRRTDPSGRCIRHLEPTDEGWPKLLRVSPLLDWTSKDIWSYLLENNVSYCQLYDMGYTSIGDPTNTSRNSHLRKTDPVTGEVSYLPAYTLLDDDLERDGRN